jgi:ABC-type multidrug transport system fused ATPase/permease subunit
MVQATTTAAPANAPLAGLPQPTNGSRPPAMPGNIFRYVLATSALHQGALAILTVAVFLIELVPLELQRRIVNDLVKHRDFALVITLCAVYGGVVLVHGAGKLALNLYRGWVGERATQDLRKRILAVVGPSHAAATSDESPAPQGPDTRGVEVSMIVAEVEPIGAFAGSCFSEPLLQGGVLLSAAAYMIHLDPWMALTAVVIFVPQLVFIPLLQGAIVRRTSVRVRTLRSLSTSIVAPRYDVATDGPADDARIDRAFMLDMGIFTLKFSMNFLMNLCNHLQIIAALLLGGWFVLTDQLEIGGVVAFIAAVARLNDPWGDLVNYLRDLSVTNAKFGLVATAVGKLTPDDAPKIAG